MYYLDQAILTRWNNKNLPASITGGFWSDQVPEGIQTPYCVYSDVSDTKDIQSFSSRYQRALVQFQVYDTTKAAVGAWCELIEQAFLNANLAASNPLSIVGIGTDFIISCILTAPYLVLLIADTVWQGTMTFTIEYRRDGGLRPA